MDFEERPSKMRKLEHVESAIEKVIPLDPAASNGAAAHESEVIDECEPTTAETETARVSMDQSTEGDDSTPKLSKNQLKKQKRLERWEAGREDRKVKRKEKTKAKKERKREAWAENHANVEGEVPQPPPSRPFRHGNANGVQVPITVIFDCDFEDLMFDNEMKSLGLQITRCYSDNRKAPFRCHLAVSSFGGKMKERFDGILAKQYTSWKGFRFFEEDFVKVSEMAGEWMKGPDGGQVAGALSLGKDGSEEKEDNSEEAEEGDVVYLSAESDVTLERLKPNSTYIIGGLVDKNRHKGLCYKRAMTRGIKTAKLPIGEFLQMKSRQVLVTNHVLEIMLRWLEFDDWGKAFMEVIPKRKGGVLKGEAEQDDEEEQGTFEGPVQDSEIDPLREAEPHQSHSGFSETTDTSRKRSRPD